MYIHRLVSVSACLALFAAAGPTPTTAQQAEDLSLDEALALARQNNPNFQTIRNDRSVADWQVREAYASWIPSANASGGLTWQEGGNQSFGLFTTEQIGIVDPPSYYISGYNLGLSYTLNGATLLAPGQARKSRDATEATIRSSEAQLNQAVTRAYLDVLRQQEGLSLAEQELVRAEINLRLAQSRFEVGSATAVDVNQAEVAVGRAQVGVLQARNAVGTARLRLLQGIGVSLDREIHLTSEFELGEPSWTREQLRDLALQRNPALTSLRAQLEASREGVRIARSAYLPSLSLSASLSGFTREASSTDFLIDQARSAAQSQVAQCQALNELFSRLADPLPPGDCSQFQLTNDQIRRINEENDVFPLDFTRQPATASLTLSIPIFQGLTRQRQLEEARVQRDDASYRVREQELALGADIAAGLAAVETAYESARIEERNQAVADEQLRLVQEQYRLGLASFLELVEAETVKAQADRARVAAIFAYHDALADLEAVVGVPLRTP